MLNINPNNPNKNITAQSIGKDIFSGDTSLGNLVSNKPGNFPVTTDLNGNLSTGFSPLKNPTPKPIETTPTLPTSQSIGRDIFSGDTSVNNITKPVTPVTPVENKPVIPTTPTIPTTTPVVGTTPDVNSLVDNMFPKGQYSEEERQAMRDSLGSKNKAELIKFQTNNAKNNFNESNKLLQAYRTTRDFNLRGKRTQTLNDQRVQDLTQNYDNAIERQKQRIETTGNNLGVIQGSAGRLQSRNMMNAVNQALTNTKNTYNQLVSNKDRDIQRLAQDLKYAQTTASNQYNDAIDEEIKQAMKSIQTLDATGELNTSNGLLQARSFLDATLSNNMKHQIDYYNKLNYISNRFDTYRQENIQANTIDNTVTKSMNDGFMYNSQGGRVVGDNGTALQVQGSTVGTLLTKSPITLTDGTQAFVYQNTDGTTRVEKIQNTTPNQVEVKQLDTNTIQKYAQAISNGTIKITDLEKLGVPQESINQIVNNMQVPVKEVKTDTGTWKQSKDGRLYNDLTGKYATDVGQIDSNITPENAVLGEYKLANGKTITATKGTVTGLNKIMSENPNMKFDINNLFRTQEDQYKIYGQGRTPEQLKAEGIDSSYSDMSKPIVSWSTKSSHMTGNAVDVVVPKGEDKVAYTKSIEPIMNKQGFFRPAGTLANFDYGHFQYKGIAKPTELTSSDISRFNNTTFKYKNLKTPEDKKKYKMYQSEKTALYDDPYATPIDLISFSKGSGRGSVSEREKIGKYGQVLGGLETLTGLIKKQKTGPVAGRLSQLNPYSTNVAEFKAVIAGLVPTVARGVFNEVGVLTDADIKQYLGTLPTLTKTQDQNKLVTTALLDVLKTGMEQQLGTMARSDVDVSKFVGSIKKMNSTIQRLKAELGMGAKEQLKIKGGNLGSMAAGIGAALGSGKQPVLDTVDKGFFNTKSSTKPKGKLDKTDIDFFNNL